MAPALTNQQPSFHLVAVPWDFPIGEAGAENKQFSATLDQLRGEVGLTGLSVWGAIPSFRHFRVRDVQPRLFHGDGGLLFEPVVSRGGCRPLAAIAGSKPLLSAIAQACHRHDLALRLLLSTATMSGLG